MGADRRESDSPRAPKLTAALGAKECHYFVVIWVVIFRGMHFKPKCRRTYQEVLCE
jgi:hypothetical protein